jgi:RES domain-containing protein
MRTAVSAEAEAALNSMAVKPLRWVPAVRIVPQFPPIAMLEQLDSDLQAAAIAELASVDPSILGNIRLLPPGPVPAGAGASRIITSYTFSRPGRFNDESFGAFYGSDSLATAIQETMHHVVKPLRDSNAPAQTLPSRLVLHVNVDATSVIDARSSAYVKIYDPDDYRESQRFGTLVRDRGHDGILFDSVRRRGGECVAVYDPSTLSDCREDRELVYRYEKGRISVTEVHYSGDV